MACLHGGVFTRAQWTSFLGCHPEKVRRAVLALVAQGLAVEEAPADGIRRVCRIHARKVYRALGAGEFFRRRRVLPQRTYRGATHRELWGLLRDRGHKIEVVAVTRTWEASSRAETVLGNWARDPRRSEYDAEIGREIEWIEDVLRIGDASLIREVCGDIRGGLVRLVELRNRTRRQSGRRLLHRVDAWQTERLRGRLF